MQFYYTENSIAVAERHTVRISGGKSYWIIVWPARPFKAVPGSNLIEDGENDVMQETG